MYQSGKVANPVRGQLNRENEYSLSAFAPENLVSRDRFGSLVPRQPAPLRTQVGPGAYLRDSSRVPRRRLCNNYCIVTFFFSFFFISLIADGPNVAILPEVT